MSQDGDLYDERRLAAVGRATAVLTGVPLSMDAVAGAAARVANAPIGVVSLVDGEWDRLVGLHGIGGVFALTRRIAVDDSLCRTVVSSGRPVWISDAVTDHRAEGAAVVSYLGLGAFAGVPLLGADGAVVGSVCALDAVPREWSASQRAALEGVAATTGLLPGVAGVASELTVNLLDLVPLLDALAEAFVVVDGDGAILAWNAAATSTFGWTRQQAMGCSLHSLLFPDRDAVTIRAVLATLATLPPAQRGQARRHTVWATTRDGQRLPVDASIRAVPSADGSRLCVSMLDASGRFDAEADADRRDGLLQAVLNSLDTAVFACDQNGRPLFGNPALLSLADGEERSFAETIALLRTSARHETGDRMEQADLPSMRALAGEIVRDAEMALVSPGKPTRYFLANAERIMVGSEATGAVVALRDVTDTHREQRLRRDELAVARLLLHEGYSPTTAQRIVETVAGTPRRFRVRLWVVEPATGPTAAALRLMADSAGPGDGSGRRLGYGEGLAGAAWASGDPAPVRTATGLATVLRGTGDVLGVLELEPDDEAEDLDALAAHLERIGVDVGFHLYRSTFSRRNSSARASSNGPPPSWPL
ncbi:PAS domain-containing protein [Cryptosporangium phraense]|uniref:PAS domain-containing protein n=1 Tax=Cryptosporangium phraense TaxID=2593070 RepID=A0A545AG87_9ACTN|nr:PAS domain-containing protein [Cryptosporangium phraense]TQS40337.1 PAS domain-containing protein [Cryptosporangium phraense]